MNLKILFGWSEANWNGSRTEIQGSPAELGRVFDDAKRLHKYPKGIKSVAFGDFTTDSLATFISNASAETVQNAEKARKERERFAAQVQTAESAVPTARLAIAAARKNLGRATENLNRATKRHATEMADDARFEALLKNAGTKEDKERLQQSLAAEQAQTAEAKKALEQARQELTQAEQAVKAAEAALPDAIKTLETLKAKA